MYLYIEEGCVYEKCPVSLLCASVYVNTCIYIEEGCVYEECPVFLLYVVVHMLIHVSIYRGGVCL